MGNRRESDLPPSLIEAADFKVIKIQIIRTVLRAILKSVLKFWAVGGPGFRMIVDRTADRTGL
jgi:hypothetical protein